MLLTISSILPKKNNIYYLAFALSVHASFCKWEKLSAIAATLSSSLTPRPSVQLLLQLCDMQTILPHIDQTGAIDYGSPALQTQSS